jgi:hypothetical protein
MQRDRRRPDVEQRGRPHAAQTVCGLPDRQAQTRRRRRRCTLWAGMHASRRRAARAARLRRRQAREQRGREVLRQRAPLAERGEVVRRQARVELKAAHAGRVPLCLGRAPRASGAAKAADLRIAHRAAPRRGRRSRRRCRRGGRHGDRRSGSRPACGGRLAPEDDRMCTAGARAPPPPRRPRAAQRVGPSAARARRAPAGARRTPSSARAPRRRRWSRCRRPGAAPAAASSRRGTSGPPRSSAGAPGAQSHVGSAALPVTAHTALRHGSLRKQQGQLGNRLAIAYLPRVACRQLDIIVDNATQ